MYNELLFKVIKVANNDFIVAYTKRLPTNVDDLNKIFSDISSFIVITLFIASKQNETILMRVTAYINGEFISDFQ